MPSATVTRRPRVVRSGAGASQVPDTLYAVPIADAFRVPDWRPPLWPKDEPVIFDKLPESLQDAWPLMDFLPADDPQRIGEKLIAELPELSDLRDDVRIAYRWKREGGKSGGLLTFGKCVKPSGLLKHYTDLDYVVWFAADHCRDHLFTPRQMEALIYHELSHAEIDEKSGRPKTRGHDFEGFVAELERYGPWQQALKAMQRAVLQLPLDLAERAADYRAEQDEDEDGGDGE